MKKMLKLLPFLLLAVVLFSACESDDEIEKKSGTEAKGAYILNYGGYEAGTSSITKYDYEAGEITEFYYQLQNNFAEITSAPQFVYEYNDQIYLMNNAPDNIVITDAMFVAQDTIVSEIVKPRNCVGYGDYLYISCWGGTVWLDASVSYIVKYNITNGEVEKISLPGGPEGLQIANGKLYAALGYEKKIAVMDLSTEQISYIEAPAVSSYFVKDASGNLYVSLLSSYSVAATQTGLAYINTSSDELTVYELENVSTAYATIMALSKDESKLYLVAAGYDANWNMVGGVQVFNTSTKEFEAEPLLSDVIGINGVSVNPVDGKIYVLVSNGSTTKGEMRIFAADGTYESTMTVGAAPAMTLFLD